MGNMTLPQTLVDEHRRQRWRLSIQGAVQGVGFRPFVYRLASSLGLGGWVCNAPQGVLIEVEGGASELEGFCLRLHHDKPPHASIRSLEVSSLDPVGTTLFTIRQSQVMGEATAMVLPDMATCFDCLHETFTVSNRRYRYPFTNCTNCGPRFSIIETVPYDRPHTTMKHFAMCAECQAEYDNPRDRRFHAQPNACPRCGPHVELWDGQGKILASHDAAVREAAEAIRCGAIIAVKGLGGFHLMIAAGLEASVRRLRRRKHREEKPLALMYPSLPSVQAACQVSEREERLLLGPAAPIVLLRRQPRAATSRLAPAIAPGNPYLGVMLPYTPLHHLLMRELGFPVVATSGNRSDEPICTHADEALERLQGIAELFLVHNRAIARHVDDSLVRLTMGHEQVLRRARGYAPMPIWIRVPGELWGRRPAPSLLAVGAHLKNTIAASRNREVFISQHIGDLGTPQADTAFTSVSVDLRQLHDIHPTAVACDAHPDYRSTQLARISGMPMVRVQHHYAHVLSCMAEHELDGPVLGVAWDGSGYGLDGTIWGGEFLHVMASAWSRAAHFRTFQLPGGEKAVKEPRRVALGLLHELFGETLWTMGHLPPLQAFHPQERVILRTMLERRLNAPRTSSVGRLFDAVAAIIGLRQLATFEGQAAMALEFTADGIETDETYPFQLTEFDMGNTGSALARSQAAMPPGKTPLVIDWAPLVLAILEDRHKGASVGTIAAKFHNTLVEAIVAVALRVGEECIVLTGGCFQNRYLSERAIQRLQREHFRPYWHQQVPPNDGGIALGQVVAALRAGW